MSEQELLEQWIRQYPEYAVGEDPKTSRCISIITGHRLVVNDMGDYHVVIDISRKPEDVEGFRFNSTDPLKDSAVVGLIEK